MALSDVLNAARLLSAAEAAGDLVAAEKYRGAVKAALAELPAKARLGIERETARLHALAQARLRDEPNAPDAVKVDTTRKLDLYATMTRELAVKVAAKKG